MTNKLRSLLKISSRKFGLAALVAFSPVPVLAQQVGDCDWRASAQAIAEPWHQTSRVFADGAIRIAIMDTIEPAAGAFHLLILSPPYDETGARQCAVLSLTADGMGFAGLAIDGGKADYDPARGLVLTMPAKRYIPETDAYQSAMLTVTINQDTGAITGTLD